jgi:ArsR family transcriptional regulator, virulence genes transcriptional regulator
MDGAGGSMPLFLDLAPSPSRNSRMEIELMQQQADKAADLLKALANQHRLLVLCQLVTGEKSVGELEQQLGLRQPHLSQHLTRLREEGLVNTRRESRQIFYSLASPEAAEVLNVLYTLYCKP